MDIYGTIGKKYIIPQVPFFKKTNWEGGILSSGAEAFQMLNVFYITESIFLR